MVKNSWSWPAVKRCIGYKPLKIKNISLMCKTWINDVKQFDACWPIDWFNNVLFANIKTKGIRRVHFSTTKMVSALFNCFYFITAVTKPPIKTCNSIIISVAWSAIWIYKPILTLSNFHVLIFCIENVPFKTCYTPGNVQVVAKK